MVRDPQRLGRVAAVARVASRDHPAHPGHRCRTAGPIQLARTTTKGHDDRLYPLRRPQPERPGVLRLLRRVPGMGRPGRFDGRFACRAAADAERRSSGGTIARTGRPGESVRLSEPARRCRTRQRRLAGHGRTEPARTGVRRPGRATESAQLSTWPVRPAVGRRSPWLGSASGGIVRAGPIAARSTTTRSTTTTWSVVTRTGASRASPARIGPAWSSPARISPARRRRPGAALGRATAAVHISPGRAGREPRRHPLPVLRRAERAGPALL